MLDLRDARYWLEKQIPSSSYFKDNNFGGNNEQTLRFKLAMLLNKYWIQDVEVQGVMVIILGSEYNDPSSNFG